MFILFFVYGSDKLPDTIKRLACVWQKVVRKICFTCKVTTKK